MLSPLPCAHQVDFQVKEKRFCSIDLSQPLGLSFARDLKVSAVAPGSQCALGGIGPGATIKAIGGGGAGAKVDGVQAFMEAMSEAKARGTPNLVLIFEDPVRSLRLRGRFRDPVFAAARRQLHPGLPLDLLLCFSNSTRSRPLSLFAW